MSADVLHPAGFIETEDCIGPRLVRDQPSRESEGTLLNECTAKYLGHFNAPFTGAYNMLKSLKLNWERLDNKQKKDLLVILGPINNELIIEDIQDHSLMTFPPTIQPMEKPKYNVFNDIVNGIKRFFKQENYENFDNSLIYMLIFILAVIILVIILKK